MADAHTEFNYEEVGNIYKRMQKITGSAGDLDSIAGALSKADRDFRDVVGVEDGAIFGALGSQLLQDWDNTSSDFPKFVENFENWSVLIAQSANDYSEFERKISEYKKANPLGVGSAGRTQAFTQTDFYSQALDAETLDDLSSVAKFYAPTGATYIDTDMESVLLKQDIWTGIDLALSAVSIASSVRTIGTYFSTVSTLTTAGNSTADVVSAGGSARNLGALRGGMTQAATQTADRISTAASSSRFFSSGLGQRLANAYGNVASTASRYGYFATHLNQYNGVGKIVLQVAKNSTGAGGLVSNSTNLLANVVNLYGHADVSSVNSNTVAGFTGSTVNIGGTDYTYLGQASGTNLYSDANGNIVSENGSSGVIPVTLSTGASATINDLDSDENNELIVNGTSIGGAKDVYFFMESNPDMVLYNKDMSKGLELLNAE